MKIEQEATHETEKTGDQEQPVRGFFFWSLSPFLAAFLILMPLLVQKRDAGALITLVAVELLAMLALLGLFNPVRFGWAWRGVGGIIFLGYSTYLIGMLIGSGGSIAITPRKSDASAFNAICGLIVFGIPGLCYALFGRLTLRRESVPDEDGNRADGARDLPQFMPGPFGPRTMDTRHYAGVSQERFEEFFITYRELCSKSLRILILFGIAMFGLGGLYATFLESHVSRRAGTFGVFIGGLPFLIYFSLTFCNLPPPIKPRTFRWLLLLSMSWYAISMALVVALGVANLIPTNPPHPTLIPFWICAAIGSLGLPTLLHYHRVMRSQENELG